MENITKTITLTLTPADIDAIVDTLFEYVDIYNPWDKDFLRNLHEDICAYCDDNYTIKICMEDLATAQKLIKAVATRIGERYKEATEDAIAALL